jgi:hypothetical protein
LGGESRGFVSFWGDNAEFIAQGHCATHKYYNIAALFVAAVDRVKDTAAKLVAVCAQTGYDARPNP